MFGTPEGNLYKEMQSYPNFKKIFPKFKAVGLHNHFVGVDKEVVDFIGLFLNLDR